ncbi:MAG: hypothetical protein H6835_15480 [Planctomycetes bacterium]|nr:hypothetical protein [Planctomycetota bacterium]
MTRIRLAFLVGAALLRAATAQADPHPDELAMKAEIDAAIDNGVEHLIGEQHRDGSWGLHGEYVGGRAGLALYALLQCGVPREHPTVRRAVAYLDSVEPDRTYSTTCVILALDALREGREQRIEKLVKNLISWQRPGGDWGYPEGSPDLSCTQYAALGLWIGQRRGIAIPDETWQKLLDALDGYREDVQKIDNPARDGRTGAAKLDVAGYRYRDEKQQAVTGSMTTAALSVMAICEAGLGRKLKRVQRDQLRDRTDAALLWLDRNFDVARNPNGGHYHYYLYGLERVGALLQTERVGGHWWYVEGARELIQQQRDGAWGDVTDTSFALLFLRRATSGQAPTTGYGAGERHVFAAGGADSDVRLRGAGQRPLNVWVDGFGDGLRELHDQHGLRVVSVTYEDDAGNVLGKVAGDPTGVWRDAPFLHREKALPRGEHRVRAKVSLVANDVEPGVPVEGGEQRVEVVESPWMTVVIRDVFEPWMASANAALQQNLLRGQQVEIVATSSFDAENPATNLIDGKDATRWLAAADDAAPGFAMTWKKPIKVGAVLFTLPAQHEKQLAEFDPIEAIEVRFGNDRDRWTRIDVPADPLLPVRYELPKERKLRELEVRFVGRTKKTGKVGLAEFALLPTGGDK